MKTETTQAKHTESLPSQLRIDADDCPRPDRAGLMIKAADRLEEYERKVRTYDALAASHKELVAALEILINDVKAHNSKQTALGECILIGLFDAIDALTAAKEVQS